MGRATFQRWPLLLDGWGLFAAWVTRLSLNRLVSQREGVAAEMANALGVERSSSRGVDWAA
jgi:hypothetical protein